LVAHLLYRTAGPKGRGPGRLRKCTGSTHKGMRASSSVNPADARKQLA